jgi:RNA polymerase sigma-70 factor, ECF subfamily
MHSTQTSLVRILQQPYVDHPEDWNGFAHLYVPLFFEFCRRLAVPEAERADLVQDMLIRVLKGISSFQHNGQGSFRAWLFRLLKNAWIDRLRRNPQTARIIEEPCLSSASSDPLEIIAEQEYRQYVIRRVYAKVLAEFSTSNQQVFQRVVVEDQPATKVASDLGLSVNSVYLIRSRMLRRIREDLSELID